MIGMIHMIGINDWYYLSLSNHSIN